MSITPIFKLWKGTFYAIRQKSTGYMLPITKGRGDRGITHQEPTACEFEPPKLYHTESAAKCALTWWLKGKTTITITAGDGWEVDYDEDWHTEDMGRDPKDFHVVAIHMRLG